jgi:F-type H+-transporting ATPase subunit c
MEGIFYAKAAGFIAAAIAIGLGTFGAALGQGLVAKEACKNMGKFPEQAGTIRTMAVMGLSFIESCPIYCLIIALFILNMCR